MKDMKFEDISNEKHRAYTFGKDGSFYTILIENPVKIHVSDSGGHRVLDKQGVSHYIPTGWLHLEWKVTDGEHFRF